MKALLPQTPLNFRYRYEAGGCPIEAALDVLGGRWKGLLLFQICHRPRRFSELRKNLEHISQRMLVRQLRELERDGLITRSVEAGVPPKVKYASTEAAQSLLPLLKGLRDWGARHVMGLTTADALNARLQSSQNACPPQDGRTLQAFD